MAVQRQDSIKTGQDKDEDRKEKKKRQRQNRKSQDMIGYKGRT